jgi:hypothetical protein
LSSGFTIVFLPIHPLSNSYLLRRRIGEVLDFPPIIIPNTTTRSLISAFSAGKKLSSSKVSGVSSPIADKAALLNFAGRYQHPEIYGV